MMILFDVIKVSVVYAGQHLIYHAFEERYKPFTTQQQTKG